MNPEHLAEIRARAEAATEGPWVAEADGSGAFYKRPDCYDVVSARNGRVATGGPVEDGGPNVGACDRHDAVFIAHARDDVPALLDEVERLTDDVAVAKVVEHQRERRALAAEAERDRLAGAVAAATQLTTEEMDAPLRSTRGLPVYQPAAWRVGWAEGYTQACSKLRAALGGVQEASQ